MCNTKKGLLSLISLASINLIRASQDLSQAHRSRNPVGVDIDETGNGQNFTGCNPHTAGYISPYANFKPDTTNYNMINAGASTACIDGSAGGYACKNVDLEAFLSLEALDSGGIANDIWGWTDSQTEKEYALVGLADGTAFVDISDPSNPLHLGTLKTHTKKSSWRDIKTYADHAFIVSEATGHGMQVFDLTLLRDVNNPPQTFSETAHFDKFGYAHNVVINEETGLAVAVGSNKCNGGLYMIDVTDPVNPQTAGCFDKDGYTHDAQCVIYHGPTIQFQGSEICFASNENSITIVDVTDRSSPKMLERKTYANSEYTHQGWLTEDHTTFLANDELDFRNNLYGQTYIFDVSDLRNVQLKGIHTASTRKSIMHNEYIKGDFVYQSNYEAGITILDVSNAANNGELVEVAFFDMISGENRKSFDGSWSNYPYFKSGIVIATSIEQGFFVLRPNLSGETNTPMATPSYDPSTSKFPTSQPSIYTNPPTEPPVLVRITSFSVTAKLFNNGKKVQSTLTFHLENTHDIKAKGTLIKINITKGGTKKTKQCRISRSGKCVIKLPRYDRIKFPSVDVTLKPIKSKFGEYESELNNEYKSCPVFSSACPTLEIDNVDV